MPSSLSNRLGALQSFKKNENGITGKTSEGFFRVKVLSHAIFQITVSKSETFEDFSYSVIAPQVHTSFSIEDHTELVIKSEYEII